MADETPTLRCPRCDKPVTRVVREAGQPARYGPCGHEDLLRRLKEPARRFDQCAVDCTTDCGHCKGDPIGALRSRLTEVERREREAIESAEMSTALLNAQRGQVEALEADLERARTWAAEQVTKLAEVERQRDATKEALVVALESAAKEHKALLAVNDALRSAGIEYPLGAAGVRDLAAMASGRLEELQTAEAELHELRRDHG